jgi:hypothetical protein
MRLCGIAFLVLVGGLGCSSSSPSATNKPAELIVNAPIPGSGTTHPDCSWTQLGQNASHTGMACAPALGFNSVLATVVVDPFVTEELLDAKAAQDGDAELLVHYQVPLVTGDDVYVETKSGAYNGSADWNTQVWGETYYHWQAGALVKVASFESDWKPEPIQLVSWEPVFHSALDGNVLWVPGAGGTVYRVDRTSMLQLSQVNPFATVDPDTFVSGPITVGLDGAVFYNVVHVVPGLVAGQIADVSGVLVRIEPDGVTVHAADYSALMANPPSPTGMCLGGYYNDNTPPPWPPPDHHRVSVTCGSLRPGVNIAPAVGADGTVFTVAAPNNAANAGVLLAVNADLSPKWSASLQEILDDGCGVQIPADAQPNGKLPDGGSSYSHCLVGAPQGVDPSTGQMPSVQLTDLSSSSPVALPDGAVLYGGYNYYNTYRGHLVKFDATGKLLASYDDGWDQTPAVWPHDGSYSIIIKDNHYASWYSEAVGPYDITQVDADLKKQWSYASDNTYSCQSDGGTSLACTSDHPSGFEWCVNAAAIDENGTVYANSEDGRAYALLQGGSVAQARFLVLSLGAAYTPVAVDGQGRTYTMNGGVLTVVGK